ncbi:MAG: N-acetylmuramoyl-L-alanine amidase CwlD [Eubacteriales bacterium]
MRLVYIRTFHLKKYYFGVLIFTTALVLAGINSVLAVNRAVPATSWAVANRVFVIDPGHGGIDPGAVGYQGLREKDIVLQVSQRLRKLLNQAGSKVIMTRESDIDLSSPETGGPSARKVEDLSKRVELANNNGADLFLSIHVNAFPSSRWRGAQIFYQRNENESKKLAEAIQSELTRIMGNTTRAAKAADYFTTRNTKIAAVIIEIGFISNPAEAELLKDPAYQRKLAYAIYSGLVKYYTK